MKYKASCHCGQVAFEFEGEIKDGLACNCSICHRKGSLLWFTGLSSVKMLTGAEALRDYTFNKHVIKHRFCANCGIHTHGEGKDPHGKDVAAINLRCVEGLDFDGLKVNHYDGRAI